MIQMGCHGTSRVHDSRADASRRRHGAVAMLRATKMPAMILIMGVRFLEA
jgi:hypothetical protein